MRSKILIIVVALVLGGLAAVLAANYLSDARTSISSEAEPVIVLVAQEDLPRGLSAADLVEQGLVVEEEVPARFVAADAISSALSIESQILAAPVSAGEQLTRARFQYPAQAGLSYSVPADFVAVSIGVDDVTGVSGLLKPGDNVIVYSTFTPQSSNDLMYTMTTIAKAKVLAVGAQTTAESGTSTAGESEGGGVLGSNSSQEQGERLGAAYLTVTLALSVEDAQRVVFSEANGRVHLALMPRDAEAPTIPAPTERGQVNTAAFKSIDK